MPIHFPIRTKSNKMKQNQTNIKHEASQNSGLLNSSCFDRDMGKYSNCVWLLFGINILLHIYLAGRGFGASDTLMMLRAAYAAGEHFSISSFAHLSIQFEFVWIERFKLRILRNYVYVCSVESAAEGVWGRGCTFGLLQGLQRLMEKCWHLFCKSRRVELQEVYGT